MTRKLTIAIDDAVYEGLISVVGRGKIGAFLEHLARPFVLPRALDEAYIAMAADHERESEALDWIESLTVDVGHAEG